MRVFRCAGFALVCIVATGAVNAQTDETTTYRDPVNGVTFAYPSAWISDTGLSFYLGTEILDPAIPDKPELEAKEIVGFSGATFQQYKGTNLDGLEFAYLVLPGIGEPACKARITRFQGPGDQKASNVTIHGRTFLHLATGDAGLGHGAGRDMYETYAADRCYLFEADVHVENLSDGRQLTPKEMDALRAMLLRVMQSVRISAPTGK